MKTEKNTTTKVQEGETLVVYNDANDMVTIVHGNGNAASFKRQYLRRAIELLTKLESEVLFTVQVVPFKGKTKKSG